MQGSSLRPEVARKLRKDKALGTIEGIGVLCRKWINPRREILIHFTEIFRRKKQTVRILCRGLAKSRQPSDLIKERGGYGCVRSSSSGDREPLDPHLVTRQSIRYDRSCTGFNPLKPSESPEGYREIEASEFGISKIPWTRDQENP
jgi:hypothetical protein